MPNDDRTSRPDTGLRADTTARFGEELFSTLFPADTDTSAEEREAIAALPPGSALLIVRRGPNAGARFLLDSNVTVAGRKPDAEIFLDDVTVSRNHAEFRREGIQFSVRDLGSLNGTYYEGSRVEHAVLAEGSEVQIGKFRLTFYPSHQTPAVAGNA